MMEIYIDKIASTEDEGLLMASFSLGRGQGSVLGSFGWMKQAQSQTKRGSCGHSGDSARVRGTLWVENGCNVRVLLRPQGTMT